MKRVRHLYVKTSGVTVKVTLEVVTGKNNSMTRPEFIEYMDRQTDYFAADVAGAAGCPTYKVKVK